jgi:hypothetical protein
MPPDDRNNVDCQRVFARRVIRQSDEWCRCDRPKFQKYYHVVLVVVALINRLNLIPPAHTRPILAPTPSHRRTGLRQSSTRLKTNTSAARDRLHST